MKVRLFGSDHVSVLGIGTGRLASLGSGYSRQDAARLLAAAVELGINLIDTADTYASGQCERLLGQLLKSHPGKFLVSTKAGYPFADLPRPLRCFNQIGKKLLQKAGARQNFHAVYITRCIERSLRRLSRETLDYFFLHNPPDAVWRSPELLAALDQALRQGKVRHLGVSSDSLALLEAAALEPLFSVFQTRINPLYAAPGHLCKLIAARGEYCVVANHVFAGGALVSAPPAPLENLQERVRVVAQENQSSPQGVLIAYASSLPGVASVLSGTGNERHLRENAAAADTLLNHQQLFELSRC